MWSRHAARTIGQERDLRLVPVRDPQPAQGDEACLVLLADAAMDRPGVSKSERRLPDNWGEDSGGFVALPAEQPASQSQIDDSACSVAARCPAPAEAQSNDPDILRAALMREWSDRRRAECRA